MYVHDMALMIIDIIITNGHMRLQLRCGAFEFE